MTERRTEPSLEGALHNASRDVVVRRVASYCLQHEIGWTEVPKMPPVLFTIYVREKLGLANPESVDRIVEMAQEQLLLEELNKMLAEVERG